MNEIYDRGATASVAFTSILRVPFGSVDKRVPVGRVYGKNFVLKFLQKNKSVY